MTVMIENIVTMHEEVLGVLLEKLRIFPVVLTEIPEERRDPAFPRRLVVGRDQSVKLPPSQG